MPFKDTTIGTLRVMQPLPVCTVSFLESFLRDIGVTSQAVRQEIITGIANGITAFENARSGDSLTRIVSGFLTCSKKTVDRTALDVVNVNFATIAAVAILTVIIAVVISYSIYVYNPYVILGAIVMYIIILAVIIILARRRLLRIVANAEGEVSQCILNAQNSFQKFETNLDASIQAGLCAYAQSTNV